MLTNSRMGVFYFFGRRPKNFINTTIEWLHMTYVNPYSRPPRNASPVVRRVFETTDYGIVSKATAIVGRERYKEGIKLHCLASYFTDGSKLTPFFRHRDNLIARHDEAQEELHKKGLDGNHYRSLTRAVLEDSALLEKLTQEEQKLHKQYEHAQKTLAHSEERYIKSQLGEDAYRDLQEVGGFIEEIRGRIEKRQKGIYGALTRFIGSLFGHRPSNRSDDYIELQGQKEYLKDLQEERKKHSASFARTREAYLAQHGLGNYIEQCEDFRQKRRALEDDIVKAKKGLIEYQHSIGLITTEHNTRLGITHTNATLDDPKHRSAVRGEEPLWNDYKESRAAHAQLIDLERRLTNHLDGVTRTTPN